MQIYRRDPVTKKFMNQIGIVLSCGDHIKYKYNGEIVTGTIEYSSMWDGGYYLMLDEDQGSLPMFGDTIQAELD